MVLEFQPNDVARFPHTIGFSRWFLNFSLTTLRPSRRLPVNSKAASLLTGRRATIPSFVMKPEPPFSHLEAAYQLHFYLCFKTHYLRQVFDTDDVRTLVDGALREAADREDYHVLETQVATDHLRLLLSLKPEQTISRAVMMLKGNISRQFSVACPGRLAELRMKSPWAKGYYAASSGKVDVASARAYVESQVSHHGYRGEWTDGLKYSNPNFQSPAFTLDHCACRLAYHLVFVMKWRASVFDDSIAQRLFPYVVAVGAKRGFAVEKMSVLPDHIHLLIEALPTVSIVACALSILNNTFHWMETNYSGVLKQTGAWDVWQPSFYAGTVGDYTTAQVKRFLRDGTGPTE